MKTSTLRKLMRMYPQYEEKEIRYIISTHIKTLSNRVYKNTTFNLLVPKLGRIHTHANSKNKAYVAVLAKHKIVRDAKNEFSDKVLLF